MKGVLFFLLSITALVFATLTLGGCAFMEDKPGSAATAWRVQCVTKGHGIPVKVPQELAYVHDDGGLVCNAVFP